MSKIYTSDPPKEKTVSKETFQLLKTLKRLNLKFDMIIKEVRVPSYHEDEDGIVMLCKFDEAWVRIDGK